MLSHSVIINLASELDYATKFKRFMFLLDKIQPESARLDNTTNELKRNFFTLNKHWLYAVALVMPKKAILISNYLRFLNHK